jgi:hypothetical protein
MLATVITGTVLTSAPDAGAAPPGADATTDPQGDTVDDQGTPAPNQPGGDVLEVTARLSSGRLALGIKVAAPTDPRTDPHWDGASFAAWAVDTNGDSSPEFLVGYGRDPERGLVARVSRTGDEPDAAPACEGEAGTAPDGAYTAVIPVDCLGNPAAVGYGAAVTWDTDPGDPAAPVTQDVAPDGGAMAGPVHPS